MSDSPNSNRVVKVCDDCGKPKYATNSEGCTCDEPRSESQPSTSSGGEHDLPVAGVLQKFPQGQNPSWRFYEDEEFGKDSKNSERKKVVDLKDAEEAIACITHGEYRARYCEKCLEENIREARQRECREILDKIEDKIGNLNENPSNFTELDSDKLVDRLTEDIWRVHVKIMEDELKELRDDLQEGENQ